MFPVLGRSNSPETCSEGNFPETADHIGDPELQAPEDGGDSSHSDVLVSRRNFIPALARKTVSLAEELGATNALLAGTGFGLAAGIIGTSTVFLNELGNPSSQDPELVLENQNLLLQLEALWQMLADEIDSNNSLLNHAAYGLSARIGGHAVSLANLEKFNVKAFLGCLNTVCNFIVQEAVNDRGINVIDLLNADFFGFFTHDEWILIVNAAASLSYGKSFDDIAPCLPVIKIKERGEGNPSLPTAPLPQPHREIDPNPPQVFA